MKGFLTYLLGAITGAAAVALFTTPQGDDLRAQIRRYLRSKGILPSRQLDEYVEMIAAEVEDQSK